ncbi:MAG: signal peptidase I, partial [Thermoplasmataceae archaeon]
MKLKSVIPIAYVAVWQTSFLLKVPSLYTLLALLIFVPLFLRRAAGDRKVPHAIILSVMLMIMLTAPAIFTGTLQFEFLLGPFLSSLWYSALLSVSIIPSVFAATIEAFRKKQFDSMILSGVLYFFSITPISAFTDISYIPKIMLYDFGFDMAFSILVSYIYIAAGRKILTPMVFFFLYSAFSFLNVSEKVSPLFNIVWEVISISMVFWVAYFLMGENVWVKRLLRTRKVVRVRRSRSKTDVAMACIVATIAVAAIGSYYTHTVSADPTSSMYPEILPGSLLIVKPVSYSSIQVGEIIEFHAPWDNGTLFAHEVVKIIDQNNTLYFRTRGINNPVDDPAPVPAYDVVGRVIAHIPYLGYPIIYGRVTAAVAIVVILGSVLAEGP